MSQERHSPAGAALTALILETFRVSGLLLAAGDRLVEPLGLTSARWQVLGAVALTPASGPVPHIARTLGQSRQNVQRVVNDLVAAGYLATAPNPHHKRAKLVLLTAKGEAAYAATVALQVPWANRLAQGLDEGDLTPALDMMRGLRDRLE